MPQPPKPEAEQLLHGITVLFTKADHDWITYMAKRRKVSKGEIVRRLFHKGRQGTQD